MICFSRSDSIYWEISYLYLTGENLPILIFQPWQFLIEGSDSAGLTKQRIYCFTNDMAWHHGMAWNKPLDIGCQALKYK